MSFGSQLKGIPPVTKNLLIINILMMAIMAVSGSFSNVLYEKLGLHLWTATDFNPIQTITYMFLHGGWIHLLFNMFTLWMFGRILEQVWGARRFFVFYMICGIGAALCQELVWMFTWEHDYITEMGHLNGWTYQTAAAKIHEAVAAGDTFIIQNMEYYKSLMLTVGASGAIFGLLLGFAFVFPNMPLYLFFIPVPIKAKYMVIGYAVLEFFLGVNGGSTIAHFAHLGGMLFGLILLLYWKKKGTLHGNGFY